LEKFENAAVKDVFVHDRLLCWPLTPARPASLVRPGHAQASAILDDASPTHKQPLRTLLREALQADCRPFRTNSNVEPGKSLRSAESTQPKRAHGWPPTS